MLVAQQRKIMKESRRDEMFASDASEHSILTGFVPRGVIKATCVISLAVFRYSNCTGFATTRVPRYTVANFSQA